MNRKKVLAVGCEPGLLHSIEAIIHRLGGGLVTADDGAEAIAAIQRDSEIRLAILDDSVPSLDEICKHIALVNATTIRIHPIIIGGKKDKLKAAGFEDGLFDLIPKPVNVEEMESRIRIGDRLTDTETFIRLYMVRSARFQDALFSMAKEKHQDVDTLLHKITELAAKALGVARVSVWFYDDIRSKIVCADLFEMETGKHTKGMELSAIDYPTYFSTLQDSRIIAADDAQNDPRTQEFTAGYLVPLGITSMVDTHILRAGITSGVICVEHIGPARTWTQDEQKFMSAVADVITISMESIERIKAEQEIIRLNETLELEIEKRTGELALANAKNETLLRAASGVSIIATDTEGLITVFNPGAEKMLGYTASEMVGKQTPGLIHLRSEVEERSAEISRQIGKPVNGFDTFVEIPRREGSELREWTYVRKDGIPLTVQLTVSTVRDFSGEIVGYLGVGTDITNLKKAQKEIEELSRKNEMILDAVAEGIYGIDINKNTVFINPAAEKMLGFSADELLACSQHDVTHHTRPDGSPYPVEECKICATLLDGKPRHIADEVFWRKDGTSFPVEYSTNPLVEDGKVIGAVVVFQDISERLSQAHERTRMEMELHQAQKLESIGQLAAGIAHEINTPTQYIGDNLAFLQDSFQSLSKCLDLLSAIQSEEGASSVLAQKIQDAIPKDDLEFMKEEIPKALNQSIEGIARISEIVLAMKEFSHPGTKGKSFVDLNKALTNTITVSKNEWKYVAEMETDFATDLPAVPCLPGEINQVFLNILVNAAHAIAELVGNTTSKGKITVQTRKKDDVVEVRISDTGAGMPDSVKKRIFEPFFTTKPVGKGTGQGLSIARAIIIKKHGGTLNFESEQGKGTTFIICLPLKESLEDQA
ncbi:MAG: hypothetical protein A2X49_02265 [Lentisphaerae bacterium GWF2_52_8]|nr:MAG: hypothetical protein A2X49_02265 [Lentisphaerae bacterium GWF2_52_8]